MEEVSPSTPGLAPAAHARPRYKIQNWVDFMCVASIVIAGFCTYEGFMDRETLLSIAYIASFVLSGSIPLRIFRIAASSKSTLNFLLLCTAASLVGLVMFFLNTAFGLATVKM